MPFVFRPRRSLPEINWSLSSSLSDSSLTRNLVRAFDGQAAGSWCGRPSCRKMSPIEIAPIWAPGIPGISNIGKPLPEDWVSTSISLSLSSPARSLLRKRVAPWRRWSSLRPARQARVSSAASWGARPARPCACVPAPGADRDLDEIPNDLLDVAADIADLGELGGLDLDEGARPRVSPAAARSRSWPTPVGPIIRMFFGSTSSRRPPLSCSRRQRFAQRDGHRALGVGLADDEPVEFGDDFHGGRSLSWGSS